MAGKTVKNGKIELMRFVFSLVIVCSHINVDLWEGKKKLGGFFSFFKEGRMGVEFFFLVSGYLMAASAYKLQGSKNSISKNSIKYICNKILGILPMHLIVFIAIYAVTIIGEHLTFAESLKRLVKALPNLFLIQKTGIYSKDLLGVEWYISTMLISMWIIFPFLLKKYSTFSRIVAPIVGLFLVGVMAKQTGFLAGVGEWMFDDFISKAQLKAIAEICLGVFAYEGVRYLKKLNFTKNDRIILTAIEVSAYCISLLYIVSQFSKKYEPYVLFALLVAIILSFTEVTYGNQLFNNNIFYFLGKLSLPIYLCQNIVRTFARCIIPDSSNVAKVLVIFFGTVILAVPVLFISEKLKTLMFKKVNKLRFGEDRSRLAL